MHPISFFDQTRITTAVTTVAAATYNALVGISPSSISYAITPVKVNWNRLKMLTTCPRNHHMAMFKSVCPITVGRITNARSKPVCSRSRRGGEP